MKRFIVLSLLFGIIVCQSVYARDPSNCGWFDVKCVQDQFNVSDYGVWSPEKGAILYYGNLKKFRIFLYFNQDAIDFYNENPWAGLDVDVIFHDTLNLTFTKVEFDSVESQGDVIALRDTMVESLRKNKATRAITIVNPSELKVGWNILAFSLKNNFSGAKKITANVQLVANISDSSFAKKLYSNNSYGWYFAQYSKWLAVTAGGLFPAFLAINKPGEDVFKYFSMASAIQATENEQPENTLKISSSTNAKGLCWVDNSNDYAQVCYWDNLPSLFNHVPSGDSHNKHDDNSVQRSSINDANNQIRNGGGVPPFGLDYGTGGAWHSGGPYPDDPIYDNDPFVPNADVSIRYLEIKGPGQSNHHTESGAVFYPGQTQSVDLKGKIKNESNDNTDMARIQYCATTKKKFCHDERIWIDEDYLDHQEREHDFDPGESITKHGQAFITLASDLSSITVFKGNRSHTFSITQKHLYEKKIPIYFWIDTKVEVGNDEDYDVSCSVGSHCGDEYAKFEVLLPWFNSSFNLSTVGGEAPLNVLFTNTSQKGNGAVVSYLWDFGDGETSSEENPVHIYNQAGTYTVSLTTTSNWGESRTSQATVVVTDSPIDGVVDTNYGSTDLNSPKVLAEELTEGHCFSGTPTTLLGMGVEGNPWEWTCQGENGGTDEAGYAVLAEDTVNYLEYLSWNIDGWGQAHDVAIYNYNPLEIIVSNFTGGEAKFRSDWFTLEAGAYDINLQTTGGFTNAELLIEEDDNGSISYHSTWLGSAGETNTTLTISGQREISVVLKLKSSGTLTVNNISLTGENNNNSNSSLNNYSNLTLATGTAIGYGEGIVEGQKDDFNLNETIHFGVFADVNVTHTWRIEAYHDGNLWWGQTSEERDSLNHSFYSLNQEVTVVGTYTFKVFLDTGDGLELIGEKSVTAN